jgi:transcriptional regulator with XRE-family HTH domain
MGRRVERIRDPMNLAEERKRRDLTLAQLAALTGISSGTLADIERGKTKGAPSTWARLKEFFSQSQDWREEVRTDTSARDAAMQGEAFKAQREDEGLTVAAVAKLMGVPKADVVALEAGDLRLVESAWDALDRWKDGQSGHLMPTSHCGYCGKVHIAGRCG